MAEYVEREALLKDFRTFMAERFDKEKCVSAENCKDCERKCLWHRVVAKAPTADVEPVVHGHWISLTECANAGVYCSVCNKKVYKEDYAWSNKRIKMRSNYCPNCGANMKDGEG